MHCSTLHEDCIHGWHRRFGHRNPKAIKLLQNNSIASAIKITDCKKRFPCETCAKGKLTRSPFPKKSITQSKAPLDLIHSDLCGPMQTITPSGKRYIMTLIDDFSRYCFIYLLKQKDEAADKIEEFIHLCNTQFGRKPKILRTDQGREYLSTKLQTFLKNNGIVHQTTTPYSPQQNGLTERKNRCLMEMTRCMLIEADLSHTYWGAIVITANYLQNRLPSKAIDRTPFEFWFGRIPDIHHLHMFGCKAFMHIPDEKRRKLNEKAVKLYFVGYSEL